MSPNEKTLLRALKGEIAVPPPIWLMRQAGRYLPEYRAIRAKARNFLDLCFTPELAVEVTLQPIRRYGFDAAILFSDILVVPHALGQRVWFEEGAGPRLEPLRRIQELARLTVGGLHETLAPVYETLRRLRAELPEQTALIGFAGAAPAVVPFPPRTRRADRAHEVLPEYPKTELPHRSHTAGLAATSPRPPSRA